MDDCAADVVVDVCRGHRKPSLTKGGLKWDRRAQSLFFFDTARHHGPRHDERGANTPDRRRAGEAGAGKSTVAAQRCLWSLERTHYIGIFPKQLLLTQSLLPAHIFPLPHFVAHEPPQFTSDSVPSLTASLHCMNWQVWLKQVRLILQSLLMRHFEPASHLGQGLPQSMSASPPFFCPSKHVRG